MYEGERAENDHISLDNPLRTLGPSRPQLGAQIARIGMSGQLLWAFPDCAQHERVMSFSERRVSIFERRKCGVLIYASSCVCVSVCVY